MSLLLNETDDFRSTGSDDDEGQRRLRVSPVSLFDQCGIALSHLGDISCPGKISACFASQASSPCDEHTLVMIKPKFTESESAVLVDKLLQVPASSYLQSILRGDDVEKLEAISAFAILTSGTSEQIRGLIDENVVSILVHLLDSPSAYVRLPAVFALGNIAGDSPTYRDIVLSKGALVPLLAQFNEHATILMLRVAALTLLNLCRGKPQPPFEQVRLALPVLQILVYSKDQQVLSCACWALSFLSDSSNGETKSVIEAGVYPRLVELLVNPLPSVQMAAARTVGNIARVDPQRLYLANINLVGNLVHLLQTAGSDIKIEVVQAILKVIPGGTGSRGTIFTPLVEPLCDSLKYKEDPRVVTGCLEAIKLLCEIDENESESNSFARLIDEAGGLDKIKDLQAHENREISEKALEVWEPVYSKTLRVWKFLERIRGSFMHRMW